MGGGAPSAPPAYQVSILNKKMKNIQKYIKFYKDGGPKNSKNPT